MKFVFGIVQVPQHLVDVIAVHRTPNKVAALASVISALQASGQASAGASGGVNQMMLFEIQCSALANRPARGAVGSARQLSPTRPTWSRPS